METLTKKEMCDLLNQESLDTFVSQLSRRLCLVNEAYSIPSDSGAKTALSRLFAYLLRDSKICIYVSGWSVWPSSENLDLFYGYRRSVGETRFLIDVPVHIFESTEQDALVSILCMIFYFVWDAWIFDIEGKVLIRVSHDEWLEVRADNAISVKEFRSELTKYGMSLITTKA